MSLFTQGNSITQENAITKEAVSQVSDDVLTYLSHLLEARKQAGAEKSYVASLYQKGDDTILKKVGEEAAEVLIAAKNVTDDTTKSALVYEVADLWFHCLVLLHHKNLSHRDVLSELARRFGTSGIDEKQARTNK
jgi:phosphoribosyl-ATP pyrophosphohydrolase